MANQRSGIVQDVFGELLETGKAAAKGGVKAASDIAKQTVKTVTGAGSASDSGLDWLERAAGGAKPVVKSPADQDRENERQIAKMKDLDKRQSKEAYAEIQRQIAMIRRQKEAQPRTYVTAAAGYDEEQHKDPESFFEKMKKKKEEMAKKLPWTSKQGMGTGEIRRGTSG